MTDLEAVRVALRVRPILRVDRSEECVVSVNGNQVTVDSGDTPAESFTFSHTFAPDATQQQLYETIGVPLLDKLFKGFNVTILAYGQTCSGKTYTMGTDFKGQLGDEIGVIPRAVSDIFRIVSERQTTEGAGPHGPSTITCSFLELYKEKVYDLLSNDRQEIEIREAAQGVLLLQGCTEMSVSSVQATHDCLLRGTKARCVGKTALNRLSSRSHAIFTINIAQPSADQPGSVIRSKFHLVDLAGSERQTKAQTTGERLKEGIMINQGLLTLGKVIMALAATGTSGGHVPYRESRLTRVLKDSLGGNSYTLMIACVSPTAVNRQETITTLRYAAGMCQIKNKPKVNVAANCDELRQMKETIVALREQLRVAQSGSAAVPAASPSAVGREAAPSRSIEMARLHILEKKYHEQQAVLASIVQQSFMFQTRVMAAEKVLEDIETKLPLPGALPGAAPTPSTSGNGNADPDGDTETAVPEQVPQADGLRSYIASLLASYRDESTELVAATADRGDEILDSKIQYAAEKHTEVQVCNSRELYELDQKLAVKEAKLRCTKHDMGTNPDMEPGWIDELQKLEATIKELEEQLADTRAQLQTSGKTSKLAEDRRRKVKQLEAEVVTLRQKSLALAKEKQANEQSRERARVLEAEIKALKEERFKVCRKFKMANDTYQKLRIVEEKKVCQLMDKDVKQVKAMEKMKSDHLLEKEVMKKKMEREKRVMQRKIDEANRRLEANRRQTGPVAGRGAAASRGAAAGGAYPSARALRRGPEATCWLEQQLKVLHNVLVARETLKVLKKQRDEHAQKLSVLQAGALNVTTDGIGENEATADSHALHTFYAESIGKLEQELAGMMSVDEHLASLSEDLAMLPEAAVAFRHLLEALTRKEEQLLAEQLHKGEQSTYRCDGGQMDDVSGSASNANECNTQRQLLQLLKLNPNITEPETITLVLAEQLLDRNTQLADDLELYKTSNQLLEQQLAEQRASAPGPSGLPPPNRPRSAKRLSTQVEVKEEEEEDDDDDDDDDDDHPNGESSKELERDPTFRGTPLRKRKKESSPTRSKTTPPKGLFTCSCIAQCATKRCGCRKLGRLCSDACRCPPDCRNTEPGGIELADDSDHETPEMDILTHVARTRQGRPFINN